ncbi:MAG: TetR/AcrR family transcriptional regulator [Hydrogenophaga sp.]|jgi:AcrR family transcriptional regulator|uniref:TetR/AcrR family transcriptional regulator n=1 Tax=Hydrogenophaga borbori TaxID=2294117 RepID=A0A372EKF1_9BURK|nr:MULTISPECIES: TetR/AcrR family transcriptional regulator [Hydrogenophaga]MBN9410302.1 TetR/AcrR family transcriptional regulator [Burkholderiales bacterium]NCT97942.1 TetR/AcrR family transcriptional regulator [Comamonadaceae bacterium]MBN9371873.1 TetR/AcrR family transcriptional regulator [Hydrogenophaga sp.]MBX3609577.1 TetR/AcrR family transcriptional regulator [Hydrogenophaga sp.]OJV35201.1 MAG: TetR family transcriptional regulator [Hydrogenophaga sp. 70-12]
MRKNLTDDDFMDALTDLLLAEGINGLTVGEIAARLHCSRRRLYDVAQTKEEIFCAAAEHFFNRILGQSEALVGREQDLTAALAAYLNVGVQAAGRIGVQFLKDLEYSATARSIFDRYQQARTMRLSQLIDEGVQQGVFAPCHGLVVSELILGAALRLRRPAFLAQANLTIEEAFQEFYRVLLGGLLIDSATPKVTQDGTRTGRTTARRTFAKKDVGADEVGAMLMAAWNRD